MVEHETVNAIKIAVLQEQIVGLREQQKAHNDTTQRRFNGLESKIDDLTAIMNRGRGAYAASMALAAGIGAVLIQLASIVTGYFHK
jgi:hypothetical protein